MSRYRVMQNGQLAFDNRNTAALAISDAKSLIAGWKSYGAKTIPVVTIEDESGKEVWTSKEDKS